MSEIKKEEAQPKTQRELIIANQGRIYDLSQSLQLWEQNAAIPPEVRAKAQEYIDRMLFSLMDLELTGQQHKIETMETVLALYRGEKTV